MNSKCSVSVGDPARDPNSFRSVPLLSTWNQTYGMKQAACVRVVCPWANCVCRVRHLLARSNLVGHAHTESKGWCECTPTMRKSILDLGSVFCENRHVIVGPISLVADSVECVMNNNFGMLPECL